jgi:putative transposase
VRPEILSRFIRDFKNYTSKRFLEILNDHESKQIYQIWTHENHAEQVFSQKFIEQKIEYIHNNPVRAGIVTRPEDYLFSSARNYAGLECLLEVEIADFKWKTVN